MRNIFTISALLFVIPTSNAHQPVMDMAPRWEDGYGFQVRNESYGSSKLLDGENSVDNTLGLKSYTNKTWYEGVYTFERSKRVTFKLPYIEQSRTKNISGNAVKQHNSGFGDLIVGLPLKHYSNKGDFTNNFGFTPSLKLPTGSSKGSYPISDGSVDLGLSFSYSSESFKFYQLYDLFYWNNNKGKRNMEEGDEFGLDINWGYHPFHNKATNTGMFIMWDITARHNERSNQNVSTSASGGQRIHSGPIFILYRDNIMFRTEYKLPFYEKKSGIGLSRGEEFTIGIGITF